MTLFVSPNIFQIDDDDYEEKRWVAVKTNQKEPQYIKRINHLLEQYQKLLNNQEEKQRSFSQLYAIIVNFLINYS